MAGKRWWILLGIANILLIILQGIYVLNSHYDSVYAKYGSEWMWEKERGYVYSVPEMKRGVYAVSVQYAADNSDYILSCDADAFIDGSVYPVIYAEDYRLDSHQNNLSFRFWVNRDIDYLVFFVRTGTPSEEIDIESICIEKESIQSLIYLTIRLCIILFLSDVIVIAILDRRVIYRKVKENTYVISGLFIIFCICSLSVISGYQPEGHDIAFHWARIAGLAEGLMSGNLPVRVQPGWCFDYGYPVSVFYGDILLYIPALLYGGGLPIIYAYKFYLLCINVGTIGIAYYCYRRLSGDKHIAVACTALYCVSIYRIMNVFARAAVGEYSAYMFLPLVLLGMKEILCTDTGERDTNHGCISLCIGMTGLIQTHVLSVEMACIMLGIVVIALNRRLLHREIILGLLKSVILTLCLNCGFLVPFLAYSRQNLEVFRAKASYGIQGEGLSLYELFSLGTSGNGGSKLSTQGLYGRIPISLGLSMIMILVLTLIALVRLTWNENEKKRMLFVLGIAGTGLFMSTYYFPWNGLAAIPLVRNLVSSIQFPWRFISVTLPILTYVACLLFLKIKENVSREKTGYLLVGICLVTALQGMYYTDLVLRNGNYIKYDGYDILRDYDSVMVGEYLIEDTETSYTRTGQEVSGQNITVTNTERSGNRILVSCKAMQDAFIEFPIFAYDYYRCVDATTKEVFPVTIGENNKIRVNLPSGYEGDLMVYFAEPWYWRLSEIISILTFAGIAAYMIRIRCRERQ